MLKKRSFDILIFFFIAALLWYDIFILEGENYYVISLVILLTGILRFLFSFEASRPSIPMLTMIAALCGTAAASRIVFFFLPQIKPVAAIVIIAGVVFGSEAGFVTGAVSALVSNFYFGQGSWTPFQMFALGLIGFLAGILLHGTKNRTLAALYGFLSVVILYGGIVDLNTIFMVSGDLTGEIVAGVYLTALPFNLLFGAATAVFLFLLYRPIVRRLERISRKYCLIDKNMEK